MPSPTRVDIADRMSRYIDRLFASVAERVADRVSDRLDHRISELEAHLATIEVAMDAEAMADLREAEPDDEAVPYDVVRKELGLGESAHQTAR
jgi:hypothetical protein